MPAAAPTCVAGPQPRLAPLGARQTLAHAAWQAGAQPTRQARPRQPAACGRGVAADGAAAPQADVWWVRVW